MSAKRKQQNLNLSGFSPIQLNISSPTSVKSPGKDFGINQRIEVCREKLISGFERWKLAEENGAQGINIIHNLKEKARRSGDSPYPPELETFCKKLQSVKIVLESVMEGAVGVRKEIAGSINILQTIKDNEELEARLVDIQNFLDALIHLYDANLQTKLFVIENIAHTSSTLDSHALIASWSCDAHHSKIFVMIAKLKISPLDHRWTATDGTR